MCEHWPLRVPRWHSSSGLLLGLLVLVAGLAGPIEAADATSGLTVVQQEASPASDAWRGLLDVAKTRAPARAAFSERIGAIVEPSPDGRVFTVFWSPSPDQPLLDRPVIVTLHGTEGVAFNEIALWHAHAAARGYATLALQWWLTTGDGANDYLVPRQTYAALVAALRAHGATPGRILLHGFSRGSANVYGIAALDQTDGDRFVRFVVANAGGATPSYPINREIAAGQFGMTPFSGTAWATFCGVQDPNPERDGCPAMRRSADWVTRLGGEVDLAIEDATAGHGGFHQTPAHVDAVLDRFARRLEP